MNGKLKKILAGALFAIGLLGATIYSASPVDASKCDPLNSPYPTQCRP